MFKNKPESVTSQARDGNWYGNGFGPCEVGTKCRSLIKKRVRLIKTVQLICNHKYQLQEYITLLQ